MTQPMIAVFGDEFRDRYWLGTTSRISPEAPVPVVKVSEVKEFWGGAGNVINNLLSLGANIAASGPRYDSSPIKNRLVVGNYQLARWDENDEVPEARLNQVRVCNPDAVIISDYGKGSITYAVIEAIAALNLPTFIDSKRSPRDFDVVMNPTFFPNQKEYDEHIHDYRVQPRVVLKRGAEGIQYHEFGKVKDEHSALARKIVSVCGAGDTVIAAYAYAVTMGLPSPLLFANIAAAIVVEKPWTATVTEKEIRERQRQECGVSDAR